ncbi:MAG: aspartate kinase [Myxococcales bacterium]|nr:aspartate kinase [Myxococcales bacterium]MBK7196625.1 aspartate kinase [Myxococcales bacterium]MBL8625216.1 aspartate kinase [Myxococcales bacterium]MBP6847266.1 aspartate kinase [Kofleriaceae bacterium]
MLVVQKYGGTSVGTIERITAVAQRCVATQRAGHQVAVVVSAMSGETNRLLKLAGQIQDDPNDREVDVIVSTGEQVSVGLVALAIRKLGGKARSFLGHQVKIQTDSAFSRARIVSIDADPLRAAFAAGEIAVIAGFQGVDEDGSITTLGRGGSDTTGVAIAAALAADVCEIYTDVDGVYTTDPNLVPSARKIERISYEEMLELASLGAKVLQIRSVELGMKYGVPIHVRSSFSDVEGTWVVPEEREMEHVVVSGVTVARDEAKITVGDLPDQAGVAARLFAPLADSGVVVDMIIQNTAWDGTTDLTFTVPAGDRKRAIEILRTQVADLVGAGGEKIATDDEICKVSVVGVGMRSHAGVAKRMFQLLAAENINIQLISTSEIKISVVVAKKYAELALRTLHDGFGLDRPPSERAAL